MFKAWTKIDGDNTLALDWPLDENSIVFEIGAYEGRWAKQMAEKFHCSIHAFEPQDWAVERCRENLNGLDVEIYPYGLWTHDGKMIIGDYGRDGASLLKPNHADRAEVDVVDIFSFIDKFFKPADIDVCLVNIEGGEFILLPYLIGTGLINRFKYIWVQFHMFVDMSYAKCDKIFEHMKLTHNVLWNCFPAAVAWKRNW